MITLMLSTGRFRSTPHTDPVHPFPNRDLRLLAVAESAPEDAGTVLPSIAPVAGAKGGG
jgi:hypothetical protein